MVALSHLLARKCWRQISRRVIHNRKTNFSSKMSQSAARGALIVLEGCDRCGKTTQCNMVVDHLNSVGILSEMWRFPDRSTAIGKLISDYLGRKCELEDHAVHLLFTANRWEAMPAMRAKLDAGVTLIVDRYAYSGVAFTAAKQGMSLDWCRKPEVGLLRPDAVLYLSLNPEEAAKRAEFGGERYEQTDFQKKVAKNFTYLKENDWKMIDAGKSIEDLHCEIRTIVKSIINESKDSELRHLWTKECCT